MFVHIGLWHGVYTQKLYVKFLVHSIVLLEIGQVAANFFQKLKNIESMCEFQIYLNFIHFLDLNAIDIGSRFNML